MSEKRIIPATPLYLRYRGLAETDEAMRLAEAEHFAARPDELASELSASVAHFTPYDNRPEAFFDKPRPDREAPDGPIKATHHLASRLEKAGRIAPREGERLTAETPDSVVPVPAEQLAFDYVEREVTVTRTTLAKWEHGPQGGSRFSLDLLLSAVDGRAPIAAEVKIGTDKDTWYAFIQALASLACLATPHQYERLRKHLNDKGHWPELAGRPPMLDLYVLFVDSPKTGRYRDDITNATARAAVGLLADETSSPPLRRIVGLDLPRSGDLSATVRFAWERMSPTS